MAIMPGGELIRTTPNAIQVTTDQMVAPPLPPLRRHCQLAYPVGFAVPAMLLKNPNGLIAYHYGDAD